MTSTLNYGRLRYCPQIHELKIWPRARRSKPRFRTSEWPDLSSIGSKTRSILNKFNKPDQGTCVTSKQPTHMPRAD